MSRPSWAQDRSGLNDDYSYAFRHRPENSSQFVNDNYRSAYPTSQWDTRTIDSVTTNGIVGLYNHSSTNPTSQWDTFDSRTAPKDFTGRFSPDSTEGSTIDMEKSSSLNEVGNAENVKQFRQNTGNLWTKGSGGRCALRFFGCTFLVALYLFIAIFLTLVIYLRPPNASISQTPDVDLDGASLIDSGDGNGPTGFILPLRFNVSIWNPSFIPATVKTVDIKVLYPVNGTDFAIGNGTIHNQLVKSNARTNVSFPIDVNYSDDKDPNDSVLLDIADRCLLNNKGIGLNVKLNIKVNILGFPISAPTISFSLSFPCPFDTSKLQPFFLQLTDVAEETGLLDLLLQVVPNLAKLR
ncbi:hypothetical protein D9758_003358 [Tetrapyrgos nigripes]|uniref:Late embryogenesis abundant protein LEA-2 subgroup domain-containing protein n=1 Tax=Tetrapyrgos nigripes TaxID=182062 RepID=A0A8H5GV51_9AGAR|nr:hypothetical protein D9758_003358 [Tetrapyrgos nigripes]